MGKKGQRNNSAVPERQSHQAEVGACKYSMELMHAFCPVRSLVPGHSMGRDVGSAMGTAQCHGPRAGPAGRSVCTALGCSPLPPRSTKSVTELREFKVKTTWLHFGLHD